MSINETDRFILFHQYKWLIGSVIMDYNPLLIPLVLEVYTYSESVCVGKYSLELHGMKMYMMVTIINVPINIDKNITDLPHHINSQNKRFLRFQKTFF